MRAKRLRDALADDIDSEKRAELRMLARLRRKDMERERRKAIRNAYRRVREAKKKKDPEVIMSLFIILIILGWGISIYEKKVLTVMVNNSTNIYQINNHLSP